MTAGTGTFPTAGATTAASGRTLAFASDGSFTQALLRLTLGVVLLPHGAQHLVGAFGGHGFAGKLEWMTGTLGIPAWLATAGILLEFFGPLLLITGFATRPVGGALAIFLAIAASTHVANGFFMNWLGTMPAGAEGFEYHLLAIALAAALAMRGGGTFSVDHWLVRREMRVRRPARSEHPRRDDEGATEWLRPWSGARHR